MVRLNSENFSKFFVCLDIIFWAFSNERTLGEVQKNVEFFWIFLNFPDFFRFFRGFSYKFFCTVSYSPVLCIIGFLLKFYVDAILWGHWETLRETAITCFYGGWNLRRFTQNQINQSVRNTHAYNCSLRNYKYLTKFLESDSQGIRSKILYHEIQNFSLNQNLYLV